jgi:hypothetical protein
MKKLTICSLIIICILGCSSSSNIKFNSENYNSNLIDNETKILIEKLLNKKTDFKTLKINDLNHIKQLYPEDSNDVNNDLDNLNYIFSKIERAQKRLDSFEKIDSITVYYNRSENDLKGYCFYEFRLINNARNNDNKLYFFIIRSNNNYLLGYADTIYRPLGH